MDDLSNYEHITVNEQETFNFGKNAPPSYEDATNNITPPTSNNLYKSVTLMKETTSSVYQNLNRIGAFLFCSVSIIVILIILMALPITMIIIGYYNIASCPMQKMIPVWLIIFGALSICKNISTLIQRIKIFRHRSEERTHSSAFVLNVFDSFMALFMVIWFICGNIWVYTTYNYVQIDNMQDLSTYCDPLTYRFAFWFITSSYILLVSACFIFCCTVCFTIFLPTKSG